MANESAPPAAGSPRSDGRAAPGHADGPRVLATGLAFPEGPLFDGRGGLWCVELKGGGLVRLPADLPGPAERFPTGGAPNGLALGSDGRPYFTDSARNAIRRFDPASGLIDTVVDSCAGQALDGPNDLAFDREGNLVFTCPGDSRVKPSGYVCLARRDGSCVRIAEGLNFPNGLAFSSEGDELVVAETYRQRLWRGRWDARAEKWLEARVWAETGETVGPDGLAFGADGRLYAAVYGLGAVMVFHPDGSLACSLPTPGANPTNLAFDPAGRLGLVVTEAGLGELLLFPGSGPGAPLFTGAIEGRRGGLDG
jgi:gluconolactonase